MAAAQRHTDWRPSDRGHDYAAEALTALTAVAASHGVGRVLADTAADNHASIRTLERGGFVHVAADVDLLHYELRVG